MDASPLSGTVAAGWEPVRAAFAHNLVGDDLGAAVAVYHRGARVVDLCGGWFDEQRDRAYDEGTLQLVFSTTKGITATAVAICVARGWLDYATPVADVWPAFAHHGKERATVAQLMSHQLGVVCPDGPLTLDDVLDWETVTARLAATPPAWPVGSTHGYHAVTFGWLAGELVRRADPQRRDIGRFVAEEIADPLGVELWIGLPEQHEARVSPLVAPRPDDLDPMLRSMVEQFLAPETMAGKALTLGGVLTRDELLNARRVHAAQIPAANGITTAGALARMYAATLAELDGVRLIDERTMERARATVTPPGEADACLLVPTTFGMGYMTHSPFSPYAGSGSFGHPGMGGSVAFAQPERHLAFAYVMNRMATNIGGDLRAHRLIEAALSCLS